MSKIAATAWIVLLVGLVGHGGLAFAKQKPIILAQTGVCDGCIGAHGCDRLQKGCIVDCRAKYGEADSRYSGCVSQCNSRWRSCTSNAQERCRSSCD